MLASSDKRPYFATGLRLLATFAAVCILAMVAAGCGSSSNSAGESLPPRPKLAVPQGSVSQGKTKKTDTTGSTGSSSTSNSTSPGSDTTTQNNSGGTTTTQPNNTGGQGTGTNPGTNTGTPNTGGAAPGN